MSSTVFDSDKENLGNYFVEVNKKDKKEEAENGLGMGKRKLHLEALEEESNDGKKVCQKVCEFCNEFPCLVGEVYDEMMSLAEDS